MLIAHAGHTLTTIAYFLPVVAFLVWLASLPGKIAHARGHAQADAVNVAGWLSLLTCFTTWPLALIWAYFRPVAVRVVGGDDDARPRNA